MSRSLANVVTTQTFNTWLTQTNQLLNGYSTEVVTANTGGATTNGIGFVIGSFGANNLSATNIGGGNTTSSANLNVTTNVVFTQGMSIANTTYLAINTSNTGSGPWQIDALAVASYRGGEYDIAIRNGTSNGYQISKMLVLQDGGNGYITEYAIVSSNGSLGSFSSSLSGGNLILTFTPIAGMTTAYFEGTKVIIEV